MLFNYELLVLRSVNCIYQYTFEINDQFKRNTLRYGWSKIDKLNITIIIIIC